MKKLFIKILKSDTYPSLRLREIFSIPVERTYPPKLETLKENFFLKFIDLTRIIFWTNIAKLQKGFECCYYENYKLFKNKYLQKMQKEGFVEINNFIKEEKDFKVIEQECLNIKEAKINSSQGINKKKLVNLGYSNLSEQSYRIINKYLNSFTKELFNKNINPKIFANYQFSKNGFGEEDYQDGTVDWHADRFIPCVNAQFYPFGSDGWMPTQRLITSPFIGGIEGAKKLQYSYTNLKDFTNKDHKIFSPKCPPNTLILAFHHIMHRKFPIKTKGERFMIFITHYSTFTKRELLKSALKNIGPKIIQKLKNSF